MIVVAFDISVDSSGIQDDPLLDQHEIEMMLEHTRAQINNHVQSALGAMRCEVHGQPPAIRVTGVYSLETEQLDVSYNVDTCCQPLLLKAVMALNRG
jgi:hypothetical protein